MLGTKYTTLRNIHANRLLMWTPMSLLSIVAVTKVAIMYVCFRGCGSLHQTTMKIFKKVNQYLLISHSILFARKIKQLMMKYR